MSTLALIASVCIALGGGVTEAPSGARQATLAVDERASDPVHDPAAPSASAAEGDTPDAPQAAQGDEAPPPPAPTEGDGPATPSWSPPGPVYVGSSDDAVRHTTLLGLPVPPFTGSAAEGTGQPRLVVGGGLILGSMLPPTQAYTGFSPARLTLVELGGTRIRAFVGRQSAPLFFWIAGNQTAGILLAMTDVGFTVGSDRLRFGPYASLGLVGAGAGVRTVFTPWQRRDGHLRGLETRVAWYAPRTGYAGLYYVHSVRLNGPERVARASGVATGDFCRRFTLAAGVAAAVSSTAWSWEYVGQDVPTEWSLSPMVSGSCESGRRFAGWHLGGETAPFLTYRAPTSDDGADLSLRHFGSVSVGAWLGGDRARVGPVLSAGIWTLGGGLRAVLTAFEADDGGRHGLELRAMLLAPAAPAAEFFLLYSVWFDPRGG